MPWTPQARFSYGMYHKEQIVTEICFINFGSAFSFFWMSVLLPGKQTGKVMDFRWYKGSKEGWVVVNHFRLEPVNSPTADG